MGCDIHIYPEYFNDGKWHCAGPFLIDEDYWWERLIDDEDRNGRSYEEMMHYFESFDVNNLPEKYLNHPKLYKYHPFNGMFSSRNYALFAILAEVRGKYDGSQKAKGFPTDACPEITAEYKRWDSDAHTPSYLTLKELNKLNLNQFLTYSFISELKELEDKYRKNDNPSYEKMYKTRIVEHYRKIFGLCDTIPGTSSYENGIKISDFIELNWFSGVNEYLSDYGNEDNTRIVFWFDN